MIVVDELAALAELPGPSVTRWPDVGLGELASSGAGPAAPCSAPTWAEELPVLGAVVAEVEELAALGELPGPSSPAAGPLPPVLGADAAVVEVLSRRPDSTTHGGDRGSSTGGKLLDRAEEPDRRPRWLPSCRRLRAPIRSDRTCHL